MTLPAQQHMLNEHENGVINAMSESGIQKNKDSIFLLEDDAYLREGLCEMFAMQSYEVTSADSIKKAKEILADQHFDLLILDITLPDGNGRELCSMLREQGIETPILMLTANDEEMDICRGLDAGADDYVTKPFQLLVLMSRVRALLRRNHRSNGDTAAAAKEGEQTRSKGSHILSCDDIVVDLDLMTVKKQGTGLLLTRTEFQLLACLMRNQSHIVTRDYLLQNIWDDNGSYIDNNTLSVHMSRLREKIGKEHIQTVRGVGYGWRNRES